VSDLQNHFGISTIRVIVVLHLEAKGRPMKRVLVGVLIFILMTGSFATVGLVMVIASGKASSIEEAVQLVSGHIKVSPRKFPGYDVPLLQKQKSEVTTERNK
jgi:hypothetical protein